jgi:hypothetical protein
MQNEPHSQNDASPAVTETESAPVGSELRGVRGWLLFLCVVLTVLSPLRGIVLLSQSYTESAPYFEVIPGLKTLVFIDLPLSLIVIALSIHAGVSLWTIRPKAVQTAKRYLYLYLGYQALASALPFTVGLPSEANQELATEVAKGLPQGVLFAAIWLTYLKKSSRVQATYLDAA